MEKKVYQGQATYDETVESLDAFFASLRKEEKEKEDKKKEKKEGK